MNFHSTLNEIQNKIQLHTLPAKSIEYSKNTMETLAFDISIYYEWLGINHK